MSKYNKSFLKDVPVTRTRYGRGAVKIITVEFRWGLGAPKYGNKRSRATG